MQMARLAPLPSLPIGARALMAGWKPRLSFESAVLQVLDVMQGAFRGTTGAKPCGSPLPASLLLCAWLCATPWLGCIGDIFA